MLEINEKIKSADCDTNYTVIIQENYVNIFLNNKLTLSTSHAEFNEIIKVFNNFHEILLSYNQKKEGDI